MNLEEQIIMKAFEAELKLTEMMKQFELANPDRHVYYTSHLDIAQRYLKLLQSITPLGKAMSED